MTAEKVYQQWNEQYHLEGNNGGIQKHKHYILEMMEEYARLMCDEQKNICAHSASIKYTKTNDIYPTVEEILNAPYPNELEDS